MTLRAALRIHIKNLREFATRPEGPIDTDGKMVLHIRADLLEGEAARLEELLRDYK